MPPRSLFLCDLSPGQREAAKTDSKKQGWLGAGAGVQRLSLSGKKPNVGWRLSPEGFAQDIVKHPLDVLTEDLLALASHVYLADRLVRRPANPPGDVWSRRIELHVGVKDHQVWNDQASDLAQVLLDVAHDSFRLVFHEREEARPPLRAPSSMPPVTEGICVFSTRFSSAFGLATQMSHGDLIASVRYGSDSPETTQKSVMRTISSLTRAFSYITFRLETTGLRSQERTQRTLGFLQLALAAGLARRLEIPGIHLFDDAVSSYHLSRRQICGPGFAVRETRPDIVRQTLKIFEHLNLVDQRLRVRNPFQFSTATEVLTYPGHLDATHRSLLLSRTDSCLEKDLAKALRQQWGDRVPHCGCCFPCKMRRLAALAAGLETPADHSAYAIDPLKRPVSKRLSENMDKRVYEYHDKGLGAFKSYLDGFHGGRPIAPLVAREIQRLSSETLFLDGTPPGVATTKPTGDQMYQWIVDVHARFSDQVLRFFPP